MARKTPQVNAGSMADIAFLMLIFFLVTTTMDVDTGITRLLSPPLPPDAEIPKINERNIMKILVSSRDLLLVNDKHSDIKNLRAEVRDFMTIHPDDPAYPVVEMRTYDYIGEVPFSRGIISLQSVRGTSYDMYIKVQNELTAAFKDLRNDLAMSKYGRKYEDLIDENVIGDINKAIPLRISEAEPRDIGEN